LDEKSKGTKIMISDQCGTHEFGSI